MKNRRRQFSETTAHATAGVFLVPQFNINSSKPKLDEQIIGHGNFKYRVHKEWGNLDPSKTPVNNCHEMVMDSLYGANENS